MLSIGIVHGGPERTTVGELARNIACIVEKQRGQLVLRIIGVINVVFYIPGSIMRELEFEGLRDGTFSRSQKLLMIQVAVPRELVDCADTKRITEFLFDSLREANKIAAKYFKKKDIEYSQPKFLGLLDAVEERFRQEMQERPLD